MKKLRGRLSIQYACMSVIASGINYITLIIWGRVFSLEDYGIATTLQASVANVATFVIPLQMMTCAVLAGDSPGKKFEDILGIFGLISILELVIFAMTTGRVMQYLSFKGVIEAVLFIILIILNNIHTLLVGLLQGKQDFVLLGEVSIILHFIKLLISAFLSYVCIGSLAVMSGFVLAEIVCVAIMIKKYLWQIKIPRTIHEIYLDRDMLKQYVWMFVLYLVVSIYMNNGDILLGNLYCRKEEIGLYSSANSMAKISVFLIASPIATIIFPKMVAAKGKRDVQNKMLILAEIVTLAISILYAICFCVLGEWLIPFIYGESYREATVYILPCVIFSIVFGVFWVFYQYILAIDLTKRFAVITAVIGILAVTLVLTMKRSLSSIPIIMTIAMVLTIVSVFISIRQRND